MRASRGLTAKRFKIIAQGFSPGIRPPKDFALKGRPIGTRCKRWTGAGTKDARDCREVEALLLQPNTTSRSGATFRAHLCGMSNPGLKPWAKIYNRFTVKAVFCQSLTSAVRM
jgi:hypothetical protein